MRDFAPKNGKKAQLALDFFRALWYDCIYANLGYL